MFPHPDKRALDAQTEMANHLNVGLNVKDFVAQMSREHRYLQGQFTRLCVSWLERAAEQYKDGDYDLRNEDECRKAFRMVTAERNLKEECK